MQTTTEPNLLPPSPGHFELFRSASKRTFVLCLLIAAATLAVYTPVAHNNFVNYDDDTYIVNNPHVVAGLTWQTVRWSFTTFDQANWHPLTWLSHALDCSIFGLNPLGHHMVGVLLHAASAVILFLLLQSATGFTWRSLIVAMLFALHPVNVESVAWAAERKNVLSMFLFLLALYAYGWYARRPAIQRYLLVFALYALALMSKPQVITFPILLLLWDYWPLRRFRGLCGADTGSCGADTSLCGADTPVRAGRTAPWLLAEKIPLLLLSAASAVITVLAQRSGNAVRAWSDYGLLNRIENAVIACVQYLGMMLWPARLAAFYPHADAFSFWQIAAAISILLLITLFAASQWRRQPDLLVGWLWFLISMFPMIGVMQVGEQSRADRYAYLPFIGLFLLVVWFAADYAAQHHLKSLWTATAAIAILLALSTATRRQIAYWRDSSALWLHAIAVTDNNFVAHDNLAIFLAEHGRVDDAAVHFRAALAIKPNDLPAMLNLGTYEHAHGNLPSAIERYSYVASHAADITLRSNAYANLGSAYRQLGDDSNAKRSFQQALQLAPNSPISLVGLGLIAHREGNFAEAARQFSRAMTIAPTDVGYLLLARALENDGHSAEAQAARERAAQLSSDITASQKEADGLLGVK